MNRKRTAILVAVAFICGVGSFLNARLSALSGREGAAKQWLGGASAGIIEMERQFAGRLDGLRADLAAKQRGLASALDDPCTPDSFVLEHAEKVIAAHEGLMRAVGEHVVGLRSELPAADRDYLMGLCADSVRGPISRTGGGQGRRNGGGRGYGYGRGRGAGKGGYGMRMGGMNRLARRLDLSPEQSSILREKDPDFEQDSVRLRDALLEERAKLLAAFEDPSSTGDDLLGQLDKMISAHSRIERRIAEYVLVLRTYLSIEQQKWLIGLCRRQLDSEAK